VDWLAEDVAALAQRWSPQPTVKRRRSNRGKSRGGQGDWALARIRLGSGGTAAPRTLSRAPR
jgi:hypothetical protein